MTPNNKASRVLECLKNAQFTFAAAAALLSFVILIVSDAKATTLSAAFFGASVALFLCGAMNLVAFEAVRPEKEAPLVAESGDKAEVKYQVRRP